MTLLEFEAELKTADWYYDYSDDYSVWVRGKNQIEVLIKAYRAFMGGPDEVAAGDLWVKYGRGKPV